MKRRTTPIKRSGISSYKRHGKRPCDYSAMYARCTHLRRPSSSDKAGEYMPHVANPFYRAPGRTEDVWRDETRIAA